MTAGTPVPRGLESSIRTELGQRVALLWDQARDELDRGEASLGFDHWLEAFDAAPYFSPLVDDIHRRGLREALTEYCKDRLETAHRRVCLLALAAMESETTARIKSLTDYQDEYPTTSLVHAWTGSSLLQLYADRRKQGSAAEVDLKSLRNGVRELLHGLDQDPFDEMALRKLITYIPGIGTVHSRFKELFPPETLEAVRGFRLMLAAVSPEQVRPSLEQPRELLVKQAEESFEGILEREPRNPRARYLQGKVAFHKGEYPRAVKVLGELAVEHPRSFNVVYALGRALMDGGELERAVQVFAGINQWHVEPAAYHNIAICRDRMGNMMAYQENLRKALRINPFYEASLQALALACVNEGRRSEAMSLAARGATVVPGNAMFQYLAGHLLSQLGDYERAIPFLRRSVILEPSSPWPRYELAAIMVIREEFDEARAVLAPLRAADQLSRSLQGKLDDVFQAQLRRAVDWENKGRLSAALHEYRRLRELTTAQERVRMLEERIQNLSVK